MSAFPSFAEFFQDLWKKERSPFPWQTMLADRADKKGWPGAIDLPTASGDSRPGVLEWNPWDSAPPVGRMIRA